MSLIRGACESTRINAVGCRRVRLCPPLTSITASPSTSLKVLWLALSGASSRNDGIGMSTANCPSGSTSLDQEPAFACPISKRNKARLIQRQASLIIGVSSLILRSSTPLPGRKHDNARPPIGNENDRARPPSLARSYTFRFCSTFVRLFPADLIVSLTLSGDEPVFFASYRTS